MEHEYQRLRMALEAIVGCTRLNDDDPVLREIAGHARAALRYCVGGRPFACPQCSDLVRWTPLVGQKKRIP